MMKWHLKTALRFNRTHKACWVGTSSMPVKPQPPVKSPNQHQHQYHFQCWCVLISAFEINTVPQKSALERVGESQPVPGVPTSQRSGGGGSEKTNSAPAGIDTMSRRGVLDL